MTVEVPDHIANRLGSYLKLADQAVAGAKTRALRPHGVTVPQYVTLMALHILPEQSIAQLARTASVTPQTMSTILNNLEDKELVTREKSPSHTRVVLLKLTPEGHRVALAADEAAHEVEQLITNALSPLELGRTRETLSRVVEVLKASKVA
ncbi:MULTISPECIES: MarR family transcriptional regulator [Micrococcaceae]|jgi:DNA-binding MarR family transcriptional regulator|uniref:Transcriptional regulator, MarR family n=1 Tax=Paenarthrobacter aurescens (strain TC1) TaxID=290340 RepID=A1RA05_PAEAT|nr:MULTISPECIES: MarR family transcriptional regulator [Micrococcaceae]ABM09214.1 putative transcriptional regulator, MarR family [Paenarthrobacter aurescens TC1]MBP2269103.1 DNA-binding MarR family transcriptional regulator [Pseudarthrobacter sp. PvP004]